MFVCFYWMIFKQLYTSGQRGIDLMNETAPGFMAHLQPIWRAEVILGITRLLDPAVSLGGRGPKSMTLAQLLSRLDPGKTRPFGGLRRRLRHLKVIAKPFYRHRHKWIAHADYWHASQVKRSRLPDLPKAKIEEMLKAIEDFMNDIRNRYGLGNNAYTGIEGAPRADGGALLWSLAKAAAWNDMFPNALENAQRLDQTRYRRSWG